MRVFLAIPAVLALRGLGQRRRRQRPGAAVSRALVLAAAALALGAPAAAAVPITVDTLDGGAPTADGRCSLHEALLNADGDTATGAPDCPSGAGADTVRFKPSGVVTLSARLPELTSEITVDGGGDVSISGDERFNVFVSSGTLRVQGLTIRDARSFENRAGAISNIDEGVLRVDDSRFVDNVGVPWDIFPIISPNGGIATAGDAIIRRSRFSGNVGRISGALSNQPVLVGDPAHTLTVQDSTFADNRSETGGAALANTGKATTAIQRSTFTGNASDGPAGAVSNVANGILLVGNSTFTGNTGEQAGALGNNDSATQVVSSTFTANTSRAGTSSDVYANGGGVELRGTLLAGAGDNCSGTPITDSGSNVEDGASCGLAAANGSQPNATPRLDPRGLRDNGGPTDTMTLCTAAGVPAAGCPGASPAINAAGDCSGPVVGGVDQRGIARPIGAACDVGAVEVGSDRFRMAAATLSVAERAARVVVERLDAGAGAATIDYAGSGDFAGISGTLSFGADETRKTIELPDDALDEPDATGAFTLSNAQGAALGEPQQTALTVVDDDQPPVLSVADVEVTEGAEATLTVRLSAPSGRQVSVGTTTEDGTALGGADYVTTQGPVTIAPGETEKTVDVPTVEDRRAEGKETFGFRLVFPTNASLGDNVAAATIDDDDVPGLVAAPTAGLQTSETGGQASFTVSLDTEPTGQVTVVAASQDGTEGVAAPQPLVFGPGNWDVPQAVQVVGLDDPDADGDIAYTVRASVAQTADPSYAGRTADAGLTNVDDDTAAVDVAAAAGLTTTEAGGKATFTVRLSSRPGADVTLPLSSSDVTVGTVAPPTLTFTALDWDTPQTVTVTGVDDADDDGDVAYTAVTGAAASADAAYAGKDAADVALTNVNDDAAPAPPGPDGGATPISTPTPEPASTPEPSPSPSTGPTPKPARRCTIRGTKGRDKLRGTKKRDVICGLGGDDVIRGLRGRDVLNGGPGRDRLYGGKGRDALYGGKGKDRLFGGPSKDVLRGGPGKDHQKP